MKRVTRRVLTYWIVFSVCAWGTYRVWSAITQLSLGRWLSAYRSDFRSAAINIEAYRSDNGVYPVGVSLADEVRSKKLKLPRGGEALLCVPEVLSYPDRSAPKGSWGIPLAFYSDPGGFLVFGMGPDRDYDIDDPARVFDSSDPKALEKLKTGGWTFDPTNGTRSSGDCWSSSLER